MNARWIVVGAVVVGLAWAVAPGSARSEFMMDVDPRASTPFAMLDRPAGSDDVSTDGFHPSLAGGAIAALGDGALVIDEDSGMLVRVGEDGAAERRVFIGRDAAQLVVDRAGERAWVSDRAGDRIAVIDLARLRVVDSFATPAEPYGLALSPDETTLLVVAVADRRLVAYDAGSGETRWAHPLGPEPRSVAIAPDGREALVTYLGSGAAERVWLGAERRTSRHVSLDNGSKTSTFHHGIATAGGIGVGNAEEHVGRRFARAAFAARYLGSGLAVVGHQLSTPVQAEGRENVGSYGGGFDPPVAHRLAFVDTGDRRARVASAHVKLHQPRAIAYDAARDRLYVVGHGSDDLLVLSDATRTTVRQHQYRTVASGGACGPTGIAVANDGTPLVFCSLSRKVVRVGAENELAAGPALTRSRWSEAQQRGRELFRRGNDFRISANGALACTSCHPEARTDGLSWRIEQKTLQTPLLAGRVAGTHPFKWDGGDETIKDSLTNTAVRLGGRITEQQAKDLAAFLEALPAPRRPTPDRRAASRGKKLFNSAAVGCADCHDGPKLTDQASHDLAVDLDEVDTPSLIGVALSAPYYHDGSASSLRALLLENGSVHGMGEVADLDDRQIRDLIAYLETL